jgi:dTDP-4-amino-4,6-dideoxygalactose transaminase
MNIIFSKPIITEDMINDAVSVLKSGRLIKGPKSEELGQKFAKFCNVKYGVACSNGTTAIYMALRALDIKQNDEVLVPSYSFIASATPISMCGAKPVFVDVNDDFTLDVNDLEKKITPKTKGIVAVHIYGKMCNMDELIKIKNKYKLFLIEDCAQSHGAEHNDKVAGSFGDISCFSFFPAKNMTVGGDGGIALTNDDNLYKKLLMLRDHGRSDKFNSELLTLNFRLSEVLAAIGVRQIDYLNKWNKRRIEIANKYNKILSDNVIKPIIHDNQKHVFHLYVIRTNKRDELKEYLKQNGIETGIHYPIPIHLQPIYASKEHLVNTEKFVNEILSLPIHPSMSDEEVNYVGAKINEFFNNL